VGISLGPGRFTGLRIGVTCAKTFAFAVGCPITGIDTLQAIAEECPEELSEVTVIADAQRGDLYVGNYRNEGSQWIRQAPITFHPAKEWIGSRSEAETVTGPALERWVGEFPVQCTLLVDHTVPEAKTICEIANRQLETGDTANIWGLEPYYLRKSSAEEQWEHRNRK
ncbi:MAG: tRNA (adenosine(37)-N6)-threonylcarbamoyltransferase complex dimerization subunit type 1 TsaB, partial [Planctomycetaceae bacterium]|nr:tRNA (adenosine(37)-N6)-threonylcarbamoyltransferase complex dimerization subunit type 1 TsaB [Planctomycetaceae bacterium]